MERATLNSLQVYRGAAALAVVALHASVAATVFAGAPQAAARPFSLGYLGVDFFFVLSGFIIAWSHLGDTGAALPRYALKRLLRIYPAYLPVSLAMLLAYRLLPGVSGSEGRPLSLSTSLLLLPADSEPALGVAWTLVHELLFYLVFASAFASRRLLGLVLAAWAGLIAAHASSLPMESWTRYLYSPLNLEFMLGVIAAWQVRSRSAPAAAPWLLGVGAALALAALLAVPGKEDYALRLLFAAGLALLVAGTAWLEQRRALRWPAALLLLGDASYSIYLVHNPALSLLARGAGRLDLPWPLAMVTCALLAVGAGVAYHKLLEKPVLDYSRRRLRRRAAETAAAAQQA